jgi:signal transduction histidine kinase
MRRNLTVLVAATTTAVVVALVIPLALLVGRLAQDRALTAATQQAQSVAVLVAAGTPSAQLQSVLALNDQRNGLRTSIAPPATGTAAAQAAIGPAMPAADLARARQGQSFTRTSGQAPDGAAVYLPVAATAGTYAVRVGVSRAALTEGVARARILLIALALGLVMASLVAAVVLARRVSAPLVNVAAVAHELREGRLQRRAEPGGPPEVREVGTALNQLAGRIGELLQAEREAAADLSHRLRTPVTALRLAVDATADPEERSRLREQLDRLEGTVDAVVRQSRRPATGSDDGESRADLAAVVRERTAFWGPLAEDQQRRLEVTVDQPVVWVPADVQDLVDVVDVLLDNVFAHTEPGVALAVRVIQPDGAGGAVTLVVEDEGPGLPSGDVLGRGRSGAGSTGLGLDIVARIAAASGAELDLGRSRTGGARVSLRWAQGIG